MVALSSTFSAFVQDRTNVEKDSTTKSAAMPSTISSLMDTVTEPSVSSATSATTSVTSEPMWVTTRDSTSMLSESTAASALSVISIAMETEASGSTNLPVAVLRNEMSYTSISSYSTPFSLRAAFASL